MRVAILSDIHANLPALEVVLKRVEDLHVDQIYCLGDIVGYGPFPNECVELIRKHSPFVVKGNHDSGLLDETPIEYFSENARIALEWTRTQIGEEQREYLRGLPASVVTEPLTFVHASPYDPLEWRYVFTARDADEAFQAFTTRICFVGHTHVPIVIGEDYSVNKFRKGKRFIINVGSVGQPRDGQPESAFGVFDTDADSYELQRTPYDVKKTVQAIQKAGLPPFLGERLLKGV
jgi:diadenosine tetraphosphatase ApaH/serine/threonine PP2A family protein phosphatase